MSRWPNNEDDCSFTRRSLTRLLAWPFPSASRFPYIRHPDLGILSSGPQPFPLFERVVKADEIKPQGYQGPRRIRFRYEEIEWVFMILSRFTIYDIISIAGPPLNRACNASRALQRRERRYSTRLALRPSFRLFLACCLPFSSPSLSFSLSLSFRSFRFAPAETFSPGWTRNLSRPENIRSC